MADDKCVHRYIILGNYRKVDDEMKMEKYREKNMEKRQTREKKWQIRKSGRDSVIRRSEKSHFLYECWAHSVEGYRGVVLTSPINCSALGTKEQLS